MFLAFVVVVTAVALLTGFDDFVPAESTGRGFETVFLLAVFYGVQHQGYVTDAARRELAVVGSVTAGRRGEHYVVPV